MEHARPLLCSWTDELEHSFWFLLHRVFLNEEIKCYKKYCMKQNECVKLISTQQKVYKCVTFISIFRLGKTISSQTPKQGEFFVQKRSYLSLYHWVQYNVINVEINAVTLFEKLHYVFLWKGPIPNKGNYALVVTYWKYNTSKHGWFATWQPGLGPT